MGIIIIGEVGLGSMIGKSKNINAGFYGVLDDAFIIAHGMFATVRMGVIIGFHFAFASFLGGLDLTWERGLRSAALAIWSLLTWVYISVVPRLT